MKLWELHLAFLVEIFTIEVTPPGLLFPSHCPHGHPSLPAWAPHPALFHHVIAQEGTSPCPLFFHPCPQGHPTMPPLSRVECRATWGFK